MRKFLSRLKDMSYLLFDLRQILEYQIFSHFFEKYFWLSLFDFASSYMIRTSRISVECKQVASILMLVEVK